jgi:hypothetical protein
MPFSAVKIDWTYDVLGRLVAEMRDLDDDGQRGPGDYTDFFAFDLAGNRVLKVRGWDANGDGVLEPARSTSQPPPPSTPATSSSRSSYAHAAVSGAMASRINPGGDHRQAG